MNIKKAARKVKSESDLHHSLRLLFLMELRRKNIRAILECKALPNKKYRLDIAIPSAKIGIEICKSKYVANNRLASKRRYEIQENSDWIIEYLIWGASDWKKFINEIVRLYEVRTSSLEYDSVCANRQREIIVTHWKGNRKINQRRGV